MIYDRDLSAIWNLIDEEKIENKKKFNIENNTNSKICIKCNSEQLLGDEGFYVCSNKKCAYILRNQIDQSAEWRFYGADDNNNNDPTRCGMPINPLLKDSSHSCKVLCASKSTYEMHKIRRYTEWQAMPYKEKSQYDEFLRITVISQNAGLPKMIIDEATKFHKKISDAKTFRGLNRDSIIAASVYISCRVNNYPRTPKEIATIFNLDNTSATKGCKNALSIINEIENNYSNNNDDDDDDEDNNMCNNVSNKDKTNRKNQPIDNDNLKKKIKLLKTTPLSFIERYCSKLNINSELTKLCKFIANIIENKNMIPENTPHSIAGGIIFFVSDVCNLNITKLDINNVSNISEVTINKCYKKLYDKKDILIPNIILKKYNNNI
jgi:transcription initiation factor TFIIB